MNKTLVTLIATAALALPAAASAHGGWRHGHDRDRDHGRGLYAKLAGTGTSFAGGTATASGTIVRGTLLGSGTFSASLATTWASATTRTSDHGTRSCAPATASLNLAGTAGNTLASNLTGTTCSWTKKDGTVVHAFFGRGTAAGAGTLAAVDGRNARLWLLQRSDGSVSGAVWAGSKRTNVLFARGEHGAKQQSGDCDG